MRNAALIALILAASFASGFLVGRKAENKAIPGDFRADTVTCTIHDTILRERPVFLAKTVIRTDTVRLALVDTSHTVVLRDSDFVQIPIERRVYGDSTFRAIISGYRPSLDSLWLYNTTKEITITKKIPPKRWGFGAAAGPSILVTPSGEIRGGVGVTAGVIYRF